MSLRLTMRATSLALAAFAWASTHVVDVAAEPPESAAAEAQEEGAEKEPERPLPEFHPRASDSSSPRDDALTGAPQDAGQPATSSASVSEPPRKKEKERSLCPEVCSQDEACIHGRCVAACSPSCREGTFCAPSGDCLPIEVDENLRTESEVLRIAGAESAKSTEAIVLDVGGFIFQGIAAGYEWGAIDTLTTRIQVMNTGLANYSVEPQNEFQRFEFGVGASLGYRHYESLWGHLRGFYFGGGAQYQLVHVVDDQRDLVSRTTHLVAPYGEIGYRWVYGSLLFGFGPHVMIRFPVAHGLASHGEGSCVATDSCPTPGAARFEGTLVLEVGLLQ